MLRGTILIAARLEYNQLSPAPPAWVFEANPGARHHWLAGVRLMAGLHNAPTYEFYDWADTSSEQLYTQSRKSLSLSLSLP